MWKQTIWKCIWKNGKNAFQKCETCEKCERCGNVEKQKLDTFFYVFPNLN